MNTRLSINYYLHLREQGKEHEDAVSHAILRYGLRREEFLAELAESRRHHQAVYSMIPESVERESPASP